MTILIILGVLIPTIWYLIHTNKSNKLTKEEFRKSQLKFTLITIFKGIILFFTIGCLIAYAIILYTTLKSVVPHSHNMLELLYLWFGLLGIVIGTIIGFFLAFLNKSNINRNLIIYSLLYIIGGLIWFIMI